MTLTEGTKLDAYEILAPLGAGGMGEVYRARDHKLQREVAIKVLPARLSEDQDALARFEREARAVAALSHPNILAIHDFGRHSDSAYAVTELLEGETLRDRLEAGPLAPRKVVEFATQIARGLAAAHDKGIVHRDLKPENVFITRDGQVKILDFGLARSPAAPSGGSSLDSPTRTRHTDPGTVMGTAAYMSPEQVKGQTVDHRSDIFSFGAVLYEMATGLRAFRGDSAAETMAAILRADAPEPSASGRVVPPGISRIVRRCLEKDREARFQAARDIAFDLEDATTESGAVPVSQAEERSRRRHRLALVSAVVIVVGAAAFVAGRHSNRHVATTNATPTFRQLTDLPGAETSPRLSPDGKTLLFVSRASGNADIYLQRVGGHNPINVTKDCVRDDSAPALSPDGNRIAFRSECEEGGIFLMGATGESRNRVTDFGHDPSWSPDGKKLVVATEQTLNPLNRVVVPSALWIVDVASGEKHQVNSGDAMRPAWSPHGQRIAYWGIRGRGGQRDIWTMSSAADGTPVEVTNDAPLDWDPVWSHDGRYLYFLSGRGGAMSLWRVAIDEASGRVLAPAEPLTVPALWIGGLDVGRDGSHLIYATAEPRSSIERVSFDPQKGAIVGAPTTVIGGSRSINFHGISPDGQWIAFTSGGLRENLFLVRMDGTGYRQLTDDEFRNRGPDWSPDGERIAFYSDRSGRYQAWAIRPDGSGLEQVTDFGSEYSLTVPRWAPDGAQFVMNGPPVRLFDLRRPLKDRETRALRPISEDIRFAGADWSPDGSRLAGWGQRSDGSITDVFVYTLATDSYERVPGPGTGPVWLGDGRRLLYRSLEGALMVFDLRSRLPKQLLPAGSLHTGFFWACRITRDNRMITFQRDSAEGDVWLMSLE